MPSPGVNTSEDVDKASEAVGEISEPGFTRGVLDTTAETSETVACVKYAPSGTWEVFGWATLSVIWAMGAMAWEMDGRIAKVVGEIFLTVGCVTDALGDIWETVGWEEEVTDENLVTTVWVLTIAVDETVNWKTEAVVEILVVALLIETWEMVGCEVESVGEVSVITGLLLVVIDEISVMAVWVLRYVETLETIW